MAGDEKLLALVFASAISFILIITLVTTVSIKTEQMITGLATVGPTEEQNESAGGFFGITNWAAGVNTLFGSPLKWLFATLVVGIVLIAGATALFKPQFSPPKPTMAMMPVNLYKEQIKGYIVSAISSGQPREQIWMILQGKGWPQDMIRQAFNELRL